MKIKEIGQHIHIGLDDIDSSLSGCTTYTSTIIVKHLVEKKARFLDYPNLIRLNPNVPWKTKGNGAVALRFIHNDPEEIFNEICNIVEENSEVGPGKASPGITMMVRKSIPNSIREFSRKTLFDIVSKEYAYKMIRENNIRYRVLGGGRGLIGALAAIGTNLKDDHTYELLVYRSIENIGSKRRVDASSVINMDRETGSTTFNNYDYEKNRVLITPRSPDPVMLGIRGETPEALLKGYELLKISELVDRHMIFRTNQGTGEHVLHALDISNLKAYTSGYISGKIIVEPEIGRGGHVYFRMGEFGREVNCAVYQPAGNLRKTFLNLKEGDKIQVGGGVRKKTSNHPLTINVEYLKILNMVENDVFSNPFCKVCGKRMKSQGRNQPFRCEVCKSEDEKARKILNRLPRDLSRRTYLPSPGAQRHLTRPLERVGIKNKFEGGKLHINWFSFDRGSIKPFPTEN